MSYATIEALRGDLGKASGTQPTASYIQKMLHDAPEGVIVTRHVFLLQQVAGKRVLEFGASGPMHAAIVKAAASVLGVDREDAAGVVGFDLDDVAQTTLPAPEVPPEVIICGEVLEHLSNPGWFLTRLRRQFQGVPVVITVPNAFSEAGRKHILKGIECVNPDHVAWYSPHTLTVLLARVGYQIREFAYYNGNGPTAEGVIAVVR